MTVLQLGLAIAFGLSLAGFCAWSVWTWSVKSLAPGADWTSRAIFYTGQGIVWVAIVTVAGGIFGLAAAAALRLFLEVS